MIYFMIFVFLLNKSIVSAQNCGQAPRQNRVAGGSEATPHSWPWQVSLQYYGAKSQAWFHDCGGTLIHPQWILTSAACADTFGLYPRAVLGKHNIYVPEFGAQTSDILLDAVHVLYNTTKKYSNSIALIKLRSPVTLTDKIDIACLPTQDEVLPDDSECYVVGWGSIFANGPLSSNLQQAQLPRVSYSLCSDTYWWTPALPDKTICAGNTAHGACTGDYGGPLICKKINAWTIYGIVNFINGKNCLGVGTPTVFTQVSAYISWIQNVMARY
ncbi:elastase-1-like [Lethenteron reissneri]|uniref:elastase-1-like n=1 Tax=Lethenteron reissneri TaxID=7753 RepID=UPI002AB722F3|nr:elastase-1-like [Lethenteron reissneri]